MEQLILHLFGDYILQSDWMAENKTKRWLPAWIHASVYSIPFGLLCPAAPRPALALIVILLSHYLIDRYRLARYVVWAKNWLGPARVWRYGHDVTNIHTVEMFRLTAVHRGPTPKLAYCPNGYPPDKPVWLSVWLLIIADNTLHLAINYAALRWL